MSTCVVARRNFPKRVKTIFSNKNTPKTQKMLIIRQNDWWDVGRPLSCNAFAIARFLVKFWSLLIPHTLVQRYAPENWLLLKLLLFAQID